MSKHPKNDSPSVPVSPQSDVSLPTSLNLMAILRSFPKLSAAGPSGLRIQHLIDAAEVPLQTPILQLLRKVINILASGKAPADVSIFLAGGNLTALQKSKPDCPLDVCPIAVGEALRRLVGKCLCSMVKVKAAEFFDPLQRGVACAAGAEKIAHGHRDYIDENWHVEGFTVLKIDLVNAFNLVSRQALLSECSTHFPELLPWVSWCYCRHPVLWHTLGNLSSQSGVQQGDPMGPLLFSLVLNVVIKVIATHPECCDLCYHVWYLDDGVLAGPSSHVRKALDLLMELGPPLGLRVNIKKCEVFSSGCLAHFPIEMKQSSKPNLEILGIPIGDADFCSAVLDRKRSEAGFLLKRLEDVGQVDPPGTPPATVSLSILLVWYLYLSLSLFCIYLIKTFKNVSHLVQESYGAWGKEALEAFSMLASRLATSSSRPKSMVLSELYGWLNLHLVRANVRAILCRLSCHHQEYI